LPSKFHGGGDSSDHRGSSRANRPNSGGEGRRKTDNWVGGERKNIWCSDLGGVCEFTDIETHNHDDILDDINFMLEKLIQAGIVTIIVVDMTIPVIPPYVVRVIIPDLECWFLTDFSPDTCNLGERAKRYFYFV